MLNSIDNTRQQKKMLYQKNVKKQVKNQKLMKKKIKIPKTQIQLF